MLLRGRDDLLATVCGRSRSRDRRDIRVDVGQGLGRKTQKARPRLQYLRDGFFLIRHGGNDEVRVRRNDLVRIRSPRIGEDDPRAVVNGGNDVGAIPGAGDHAIEFTDSFEDYGRAGL